MNGAGRIAYIALTICVGLAGFALGRATAPDGDMPCSEESTTVFFDTHREARSWLERCGFTYAPRLGPEHWTTDNGTARMAPTGFGAVVEYTREGRARP